MIIINFDCILGLTEAEKLKLKYSKIRKDLEKLLLNEHETNNNEFDNEQFIIGLKLISETTTNKINTKLN